jgi:arylsulfatase A-like enzyme
MTDKPHPIILLITDDQLRWDFYGSSGAVPGLRTPGFDRLQAEDATLTNTYANCPVCVSARRISPDIVQGLYVTPNSFYGLKE